jgi:cytidylate kinase
MRIAISGKMCSGKTFVSSYLMKTYNLRKHSFADKLKEIATDLFEMKTKNRKLLQHLGDKMKEIDKDVWITYLMRSLKNKDNIIIDDVRFMNELEHLQKENFLLIRINVDNETQKERLKECYGLNYSEHVSRLNHISEIDLDDCKKFNLTVNSDENIIEKIDKFLSKHYKLNKS